MANIKRIEQRSDWLTYELKTDLLDPPILKVRLRPMTPYDILDNVPETEEHKRGAYVAENALAAVVSWDITENGVEVPVTVENKMLYLKPMLGEEVVGRGGALLGRAIFEDSQDRTLFLKN